MSVFVCFNGEVLPEQEVKVSPLNRGMMYGDGCFETLRSYQGKFLRFDQHYLRLMDALDYLDIDHPFDLHELKTTIEELLIKNNLMAMDAMIRIQCWRTGGRGYKMESRMCDWLITANKFIETNYSPLTLIKAKTPVIAAQSLNRSIKLSNGINYIIAAQEAQKQSADDALMLTIDGYVSETTISNTFWGTENRVYTPSIDCDLLPGVTRHLVIDAIQESALQITEGRFTMGDIMSSDFMFCTNSLIEIQKVAFLDKKKFDINHSTMIEIESLFRNLKSRLLE